MGRERSPRGEGSNVVDEELFTALYPSLRRFAAVVADIDMDPDDLVQDALMRALQGVDLSDVSQPGAYLKRVMVNVVASRRRRKGILRRITPKLASETSSIDSYPSDLAVLEQLAPIDRAVVFLIDVEGMPSGEAAELLGLTALATRKRASRARRRLRTVVDEHPPAIVTNPEGRQ